MNTRVLVVYPEDRVGRAVEKALAKFDVMFTGDIQHAIALAKEWPPDIVMLAAEVVSTWTDRYADRVAVIDIDSVEGGLTDLESKVHDAIYRHDHRDQDEKSTLIGLSISTLARIMRETEDHAGERRPTPTPS